MAYSHELGLVGPNGSAVNRCRNNRYVIIRRDGSPTDLNNYGRSLRCAFQNLEQTIAAAENIAKHLDVAAYVWDSEKKKIVHSTFTVSR